MAPPPQSCDTFVYVAGLGGPSCTLFGKNSDRPSEEEHEVVYIPGQKHTDGAKVKCTYIEIPEAPETLSVVLSRPRWLWGCEMGANACGVVGGNEAVGSLLGQDLGRERRLLGMDLLRLALERGRTAKEAVEACVALLEEHGQGGGCSEGCDSWTYENSFLFADAAEAYVVETAGIRYWAVERVAPGTSRNISNGLSIRTEISSCSEGLMEFCQQKGWWDGKQSFDWKCVMGRGCSAHANLEVCGRERAGREHLEALGKALAEGKLRADDAAGWAVGMAGALRDEDSGICFRDMHSFNSTGSQISWLPAAGQGVVSHLFTCASDPLLACYKRFVFPPEGTVAAQLDHGSLELWRRWRVLALKGGLEEVLEGAEEVQRVEAGLRLLEEEALRGLAEGSPGSPDTLAAAVRRELELLSLAPV